MALGFLIPLPRAVFAAKPDASIAEERIAKYRQKSKEVKFNPASIADLQKIVELMVQGVWRGYGILVVGSFIDSEVEITTDEHLAPEKDSHRHLYFEKSNGAWQQTKTKFVSDPRISEARSSISIENLHKLLEAVDNEMWGTHGVSGITCKTNGQARVFTRAMPVKDVPFDRREQEFTFQLKEGKWILTDSKIGVLEVIPR